MFCAKLTQKAEIFKWYPIETADEVDESYAKWMPPQLLIRVQVVIRDGDDNMDFGQEKASVLYIYSKVKSIIKTVNDTVEASARPLVDCYMRHRRPVARSID